MSRPLGIGGLIFFLPSHMQTAGANPANLIAALAHFLQHPPIEGANWVRWLQPPP